MYLFQIGHLFIQGPNTKDLMISVDTCETINESIVQLVFQLVIIMSSDQSKPVSKLQIMVVTWSLLMASKGPAEDFLATRMKRLMKEKEGVSTGVKVVENGHNNTEDEDGHGDRNNPEKGPTTYNRMVSILLYHPTTFCGWISKNEIEDEVGANIESAENKNASGTKFLEEENFQAKQHISACLCKQIKIRHYHEMDFFGEKLPMLGKEQPCCVIFSFLPQK